MKKDDLHQTKVWMDHALVKKVWRIMKLTGLFMLISFVAISAGTYSQNARFSFEVENRTLHDLFLYIEQNSNLRFAYNKSDLDDAQKVSCKFENESIEQILNKVLDTEKLSVSVKNEYVIITAKGGFEGKPYSTNINQPAKTVSGKVTDSSGAPLPGVTVAIKNTTQGTVSDANGNYSLSNVPADATLVFSFVGMKTEEMAVTGKTTVNLTMQEETVGIEEVVAVGYGTKKKVNLTGAISYVESDVLENRPIKNIGEGLQGVIPNLNISFNTGAPGQGANFNIRGNTSISGGNPLILVDGVEMDINMINPSDVKEISVLKDGSSAAIYGARSSYGVILITTKSGQKNRPIQISYDGNVSLNSFVVIPELMESVDFMNFKNQASINAGAGKYFSDEFIERAKNYLKNPTPENAVFTPEPTTNDPGRYAYCGNTDWFRTQNKEHEISHNHVVSLAGGNENTSIYASVGYLESVY